jgi:hypothetical protein
LDGEAWRGSNATELGGAALKKFVAQSGGSVAVSWPEAGTNGHGGMLMAMDSKMATLW